MNKSSMKHCVSCRGVFNRPERICRFCRCSSYSMHVPK